jgi:hypothetical protein
MYGWQTRSWRHSTEKRQLDRERKELKAKLVLVPDSIECRWSMCTCSEHRFPHEPHRDELARFQQEYYGWL